MWKYFVNDTALPVMSLAITVRDHVSWDPDAWAPESTVPGVSPKGPLHSTFCKIPGPCLHHMTQSPDFQFSELACMNYMRFSTGFCFCESKVTSPSLLGPPRT